MRPLLLFLCLTLTTPNLIAQEIKIIPDSLKKYSHEDFRQKAYRNQNNPHLSYLYLKSNILKAENENNDREIVYGYDLFAEVFNEFNEKLKYSDTAIGIANEKYPKSLPYLYFTRGNIFYSKSKLKEASNCFLIASNYKISLPILKNKIDYSIGLIKKTQGNYKEAIPIYEKCVVNAKKTKDPNYLRYLFGLAELYHRVDRTYLSEEFTNKGIEDCKIYELGDFYTPYFIANRGKNYFQRKKYNKAIIDLKNSLKSIKENDDFSNHSENCFYIAECYTALNKNEKAISYYKKVDSIFKLKNNISLLTIEAYNKLIDYYKTKNSYKDVIYYSDQFIKADKLLDDDYKYITSKVSKNYDIRKVILSKQKTITSLNNDKAISTYIIVILIIGLVLLGVLFYLKNKHKQKEIVKQREFFELYLREKELQKNNVEEQIDTLVKKTSLSNIDANVIKHISDSLKKFEIGNEFLNSELTIDILAYKFKTNSNYLSKVINETKGVNFTQYVNTLRIKYIIGKLETEKKYLNYTIQGLSEISGFNSSQTFTRAFINCTKMNPSEFIKQVKIVINS
ncbi:helix-turn-helix domain-containing protein [Flavobacterium amnicola]|uniref:Helix-turn-helix domain-containing protein n=1 Tax=Flavobacterium amnicola TaxID=2506422 RepID=A0A4Q1K6B0_9FLAO|nr:AraC family transcriptional regulator [Flavobacterium amnicola]RXR20945.1 helix-turn-helix domain-containing protein [Flavobacterium amnicola]